MGYQEQKQTWQRGLIESLHGSLEPSVEPAESEGPPDFDGGVRESVPSQGSPTSDHNEWVLNLLQAHRGGNTIDFWPVAAPAQAPPAAGPDQEPDQGEDWRKGGE